MDISHLLADFVPSPSARKPLTEESFLKELLPPVILYYATAFLVVTRGTLKIRVALLPITLWMAFRAGSGLDVVSGLVTDQRFVYLNSALSIAMTIFSMRVIIWTCQLEPYVRHNLRDNRATPNGKLDTGSYHRAWDALELCFNLRGYGWNWSEIRFQKETRPTSRLGFAITTLFCLILGLIIFDIVHISIESMDPDFALPTGGSIYDMSLPPIPRYLRSSIICSLGGLLFGNAIELCYLFSAFIGVTVLQQHPAQWPPLFENPLLSDTLTVFWSRRWHQLFRQCFVCFGFKPMSFVAGPAGGVLGAFFVSGLLHDIGLWGMGRGTEPSSMYTFFLMMGVGIVLERAWKYMTGYRVGGIFGWVWTFVWLIGWWHLLFDLYCRKGLLAIRFFAEEYRPSALVTRFARHILKL